MKKSPMPSRSAPLERKVPLPRAALPASVPSRAAKRHNSARPRTPGIPAKVREALAKRSGGVCEIQADGCTGRAVDPSHRKKTGAGGRHGEAAVRHHVLSNLLHACRWCHDEHVHRYPASAYWRGWMLREDEDPAAVPALYRGERRLLADDGTTQLAEEAK